MVGMSAAYSKPPDEERDPNRVRDYYETTGWAIERDGAYRDVAAYTDTRPAAQEYGRRACIRTRGLLPPRGERFLDVGCGGTVATHYWWLPRDFRVCVCLDFTQAALREARAKLGKHAFYVQADATRLPFRDGVFDGLYCGHVLYHLRPEGQIEAMGSLWRVLRPSGTGVVVYTWPWNLPDYLGIQLNPRSWLPKVPGARWAWRRFFRSNMIASVAVSGSEAQADPFFQPMGRGWVRRNLLRQSHVRLTCWQSVGLPFLQAFVPSNRLGAAVLRALSRVEATLGGICGWVGAYPIFLFRGKGH